jgi:DNA-binding transcriptional ArsR family regulator
MKLTNDPDPQADPGLEPGSAPESRRDSGPGFPGAAPELDAVFQALAHPVRRGILDLLREGERTVGELAEPFPYSRPAISQHLDVLEEVGLVQRIPSGRKNLCRLTGAPLAAAVDWIQAYARYWTGAFDRLERHFLETPEPEDFEP